MGFGQLLAEPDLEQDEREEYFHKVQQSSERLMDTVNDYMDIARIVSGSLSVNKKSFSLKASLEEVFDEFRMLSHEKYLDFELEIPDDHNDIILFSDKELVVRINRELLDNAVKFTQKGKINVGYHNEENSVVFFVKDTGKGISNEKLAMIFDLFTQEDSSMTRGHEGSGLGLSIAKGMVELLGGRIWAVSEKGFGSSFYFSIPLSADGSHQKSSQSVPWNVSAISKPLILVAEDDESNYLYLEAVIKKTGLDYLIVQNGMEAVEKIRQYPDIIFVLMDIKMPVMNGLEATRIIKELRPGLPVIALTAYAQTGDGHRMIQAGCDDYYAKPIKLEILNKIIHKYIN
jgi:CheY-like chemotaxis protein